MSIGSVDEKNGFVYIYDEKGNIRKNFIINGNLAGYSTTMVVAKKDGFVYIYDEKGNIMKNFLIDRDSRVTGVVGNTIIVERGNFATTYNEKGNIISTRQK